MKGSCGFNYHVLQLLDDELFRVLRRVAIMNTIININETILKENINCLCNEFRNSANNVHCV